MISYHGKSVKRSFRLFVDFNSILLYTVSCEIFESGELIFLNNTDNTDTSYMELPGGKL